LLINIAEQYTTMRYTATFFLLCFFIAAYSQITINVTSVGAVGDSATLNTPYIQKAIDSVSNSGGGTVLISGGIYSTSTIILKSNVTLRVTTGTRLKAPQNMVSLFPYLPYNVPSWNTADYTQQSLIFAEDASNIRITGGGIIDGFGGYDNSTFFSTTKNLRPFVLRLNHVTGLTIDSINFTESPQWMVHLFRCTNVYINAISVYNQGWGSNDGIDIDCCKNVLVENSDFDTNDDCIPVKTQANDSICRDITIRNCTMASYERPVKVGNECFGPIVNVHFENITVKASSFSLPETPYNAIYVAVADGGSIDSVFINNVQVNTVYQCALFVRLCERDFCYDTTDCHPQVNYLRNVWISNVNCTQSSTIPGSITGMAGYEVQNIYLKNINITVPGGGALAVDSVNQLSSQNTTRPEFNIWGDSLPAYGLFMWHANGVYLDSFCVDTQHYNARALYAEADTQNIPNLEPCSYYPITVPTTGNEEINPSISMAVFPNPASEMLFVRNLPPYAEYIGLYNLNGERMILIPTSGSRETSINVSSLAPGMYIVKVADADYNVNMKVAIVR
jgi:Glycosyl hydrolases family 28/Secretion system C-terminal sorting domain